MLKPVITVILDTRRENKKKLFPIKLRATFQVIEKGKKHWLTKYYHLKKYASKEDFAAAEKGKRLSTEQRKVREAIVEAERGANKFLEDRTFVSPELFDQHFSAGVNYSTVGDVFNMIMKEAFAAGKIGNRNFYRTTRNSIARFLDPSLKKLKTRTTEDNIKINITFLEINKEWLKKYVAWLQEEKTSRTTVSIYLRCLRAAYNRAMDDSLIKRDLYPFGKQGFKIRKTRARKIALTTEDKDKLLKLSDPECQYGVDFWTLSFFCYGLNPTDIALLRVRDIVNDVIVIERKKTEDTSEDNQLVIPIRPEVRAVIARRGNKTLNPDDYVFPILKEGLTPTQVKNRINDFIGKVNAELKKAAQKLEFDFNLTTYTARHTFASIALENGASLEFIQIALGHADLKTTKVYTSGLSIKTKRAIGAKIYGD
jgi:integrase/recombinase XerD